MNQRPDSLRTALSAEVARVRDELLPLYVTIGMSASPTAVLMQLDLNAATRALSSGDLDGMIRLYETLKDWKE